MSVAGAASTEFVRSAEEARAVEASSSDPARNKGLPRSRSGDKLNTAPSEAWAASLLHADRIERAASCGNSVHGVSLVGGVHVGSESGSPPGGRRDGARGSVASLLGPAAQPPAGPNAALAGAAVPGSWAPQNWEDGAGSKAAAGDVTGPGAAPSAAAQRGFVTAAVHMARMLSVRRAATPQEPPTGYDKSPLLRSVNVLREEETAKGSPRNGSPQVSQRLQRQSSLGSLNSYFRESSSSATAQQARRSIARAHEAVAFFHPASLFMRRWDAVTMLLLAFTATVTPFEVCFLEPIVDITNGLFWVDRVVDFLFAIDVFINFNLAYYDVQHARMVTGRRQVAWTYARGSALADIVSTIPFDVIGQSVGTHGASKLKVLRILRCVVKRQRLRIRAPD